MLESVEAIAFAREAFWTILRVGAPVMLAALAVGLVIALFQALTQMQEMTLTFVPKIIIIFLVLILLLPYMLATMNTFSQLIFDRIVSIGM